MRRIYLLSVLVLISFLTVAQTPKFIFQQNKNQWPQKVNFAADMGAGQVFIEKTGLTYVAYSDADIQNYHDKKLEKTNRVKDDIIHGHVFKVEFVSASFTDQTASKQQSEYYNYFLGNDPSRWASDVKAFEEIFYRNIYKNVDAKFYGSNGNFKYDLIVKPGGSVSDIKLDYQFTKGIVLINNKLVIHTSIGDVIEQIPEAYQVINGKKVSIKCFFVASDNQVSFDATGYDQNYDLIIDPVVVVSSYSGTQSLSFGCGVTPDSKGNMYLHSMNVTKGYPTTVGAIQTTFIGGIWDCALSKFNAFGNAKRFSTYIGGNKNEYIINCAIQNDEVAVFGSTESDTFPILSKGFQKVFGGGTFDYFLLKIDTSGKVLVGSTYIGGTQTEGSSSIGNNNGIFNYSNTKGEMVMDKWSNCYFMGCTYSLDYPTTPNAYRQFSDSNGLADIVISKFNKDLSAPIWSTYYGGSMANAATGIRISRSGKVYCAGSTSSKDFPTTPGVVHSSTVTNLDMIAFCLDTLAGFPIASTYVGAYYSDCFRFAMDNHDNVYLVGYCINGTNTITPGAFNIPTGKNYFYKLDANLSQIISVARFGYTTSADAGNKIEIDALNIDSCGNIYFGGFGSQGLPVTPNALKSVSSTKGNMYLGVFSSNFSSLKFASYYGGTSPYYPDHDDGGLNYFDDRGYFYHAVCVEKDWPVTSGAYSAFNVTDSLLVGGSHWYTPSDAFVKIDLQTFVNANLSLGGQTKSCGAPITQTFFASPNYGTVTIDPGDGSGTVATNSLIHTYNSYGTYTAMVIAGTDPASCNQIDSVQILIKYGPSPTLNLEDTTQNCGGEPVILDAGSPGAKYMWDTGDTTQTIHPGNGKHWVKVDNGFCIVKDSTLVLVNPGHDLSMPNAFTPNGDGINEQFCLQGWDFCSLEFQIKIFSRWGEKVFESGDPNFCWDGKYKGQLLSSDVYIYYVTSKFKGNKTETRKGNITLIR